MTDKPPKKQKPTVSQHYRRVAKRLRSAEKTTVRHTQKYLVRRLESLRLARRKVLTILIALSLVLAGIVVQQYIANRSYQTLASTDGDTYAEGTVGMIDTLDPLFASSNAEISARQLVFSSLYSHDRSGTLHPDVARSMSIDETAKIYTVKLRDDVMWHDGEKLTSADVAFTIETIKNPAANVNASLRANWAPIKTEIVDDYTIKFTLPNRYAAFSEALTFPIIPEHILGNTPANLISESDFVTKPIGSGPFKHKLLQIVDAASSKKVLYLTANEEYYAGAPRLSRFELHTYADNDTLVNALKSSEVAAVAGVDLTDTSIDSAKFRTQYVPVDNGVYLLFNTKNKLLENGNIRRATRAAIDTVAVRQTAGQEVLELHLPFLQDQVVSDQLPKAPAYDPGQSAKLLDEEK